MLCTANMQCYNVHMSWYLKVRETEAVVPFGNVSWI
jgi:hypothetical protein